MLGVDLLNFILYVNVEIVDMFVPMLRKTCIVLLIFDDMTVVENVKICYVISFLLDYTILG